MNSLNKVDEEWVPLQAKVFTRWVSSLLKRDLNQEVKDITKDLSNGVVLVELAEILTHKKASRAWDHDPKLAINKVQNCDLALDMFEKDGVKLVGISGKDISDNNEKLIFGLIWSLILHYFIGTSINYDSYISETSKVNNGNSKENDAKTAPNAQNELIAWATQRTQDYKGVKSFEPYDLSMCALLDSYYPEKVNFNSLKAENHKKNAQIATDVMNGLGITCFIYPEDLEKNENKVDRLTLLTQLAAAKSVLDVKHEKSLSEEQLKEAKLRAEEDSKIKAEMEANEKEEEEKIKSEQRRVTEQQERIKKEEEKKIKAENERRLKEEEEARLKEEQEERLREQKEAEREEQLRKELRVIEEEKERLAAEEEARLKADEEALQIAASEMMAREEAAEKEIAEKEVVVTNESAKSADASSVAEEQSKQTLNAESESDAESRVKAEEEARIKAEQRAEKAEQEKRELEEKLKKAEALIERTKLLAEAEANAKIEEEKEKMRELNEEHAKALELENKINGLKPKSGALSISNAIIDQTEAEKPKDKHVRIRIKVHAKNQQEAEKKLKVGVRIRNNNIGPDGKPKKIVCKNLRVTARKNGEVIPSKIDSVKSVGETQSFHVKLL